VVLLFVCTASEHAFADANSGGAGAESPKAPAETPRVARIISSDSIPAGGFTPETIVADHYRIVGLLGRGGMGRQKIPLISVL